ncbi:MAG: exo-alpha-sialidase [Kordiimonadaceae bacterium]|nr:exo-alpha-sialidase [Kordiimonadaceae bacterium]MBO6569064.1 exo-alpha-sialidase [Kordiimonadaceae bacterium]MBO6964539.1 exo-alpha-sialidase [Kordiimonadaceae bacterium]
MSFKIDEHRVLYRSERFFSAFPSVIALPKGDVLLGFRRAPDHRWLFGEKAESDLNAVDHVHFRSHIALRRFSSGLEPLGDAAPMPMHGEAGDQDANLFRHSCGRILQHGFLWYPVTIETAKRLGAEKRQVLTSEHFGAGYVFWGGYVRFSDDEGRTWSDYIELPVNEQGDVSGGPYVQGTVAVRGKMAELKDGSLVFAGYTAGSRDRSEQQTRFFLSKDNGKTWELSNNALTVEGKSLQEPSVATWPEGQLSVFHRTTNNEDHLIVATGKSVDQLEEPFSTGVKGHPYDPLLLPDGRLFLSYGYRHEPMGVRARVASSLEELNSAPEIIIRDNSPSRDTGYPSATLLSDGRILVAYYIADNQGIRGIEGTILSTA